VVFSFGMVGAFGSVGERVRRGRVKGVFRGHDAEW
jgi:hypothetical protein